MRPVAQAVFHSLADNQGLRALASRVGMRAGRGWAGRLVAGETTAEAIAAARRLSAHGLAHTLDHLGPPVPTMAAADAATRTYLDILREIASAGIERNVSLALTRFGLMVDRATCVDNLRRVLDVAVAQRFFVHIAMEDSRYTQLTLDTFETLWQQDYRVAGLVVQAALPRSVDDTRRLNNLGARVRLVKGNYRERRGIAYRTPADVRAAFRSIMRMLLLEGTCPAIATHDPSLIDETTAFAASHGIAPDSFEFQMLYGVRRDLQAGLAASGYRVRVRVPFGAEWFPYFMRRIGDHPGALLR
jgi:proline dehydrogenase